MPIDTGDVSESQEVKGLWTHAPVYLRSLERKAPEPNHPSLLGM